MSSVAFEIELVTRQRQLRVRDHDHLAIAQTQIAFEFIKCFPGIPSACGNLVVKITSSWPACHEFEPSTAEDPQWRRCTLNLSRLKRPPVGILGKLGEASSGVVLVT
ncbi:hypothetical protein TNCV_3389411 [Trichonephila clavipes]|nr:hypothetical protein TNCV_3389411 [Trichonephila clavipes]